MQRIVLYARVSTKDKGQDTTNQLAALREFSQRQGWEVVKEFVDHKSGKNSDREEFRALFEAARRREFDCVLFWSLDRFSREGVRETLNYLNQLTSSGVNWRSFTEQYLDSCGLFKDAVLSILATIAKQERVRLSERVTAGLARAKAKGRIGGRPRRIIDRRKLNELVIAGKSTRQIAAEMKLSKTSIARLLSAGA